MPDAVMAAVAVLRINSIELLHALGEIAVRRFNQQMVVIPHQAIGMNKPIETLSHAGQNVQKSGPIVIILVYRLAPVATGGDVIQRTGKFQAKWATIRVIRRLDVMTQLTG